MRVPLAPLWELLGATYRSWRADRTIRLGAGLAYYGLFSLASVLAVSIGILRIVGRHQAIEEAVADRVDEFVTDGPAAEEIVTSAFEQLSGAGGGSIGLFGLVSLLVTGSFFFLALEDAVHLIFGVPVRSGWRFTVRRRLVSLVVLLGACVTIVLALTVQAAASLLERFVGDVTPTNGFLASLLASGLGWAVLVGALTLLFRYLPSVEVPWRIALVGAVVTAAFLTIGTSLIGWYLRTIGASSLSGAASTPIAILLWIYYEAQILLAGVQLTHVLNDRRAGTLIGSATTA